MWPYDLRTICQIACLCTILIYVPACGMTCHHTTGGYGDTNQRRQHTKTRSIEMNSTERTDMDFNPIEKNRTLLVPAIDVYDHNASVGSYPLHATIISPTGHAPRAVMWLFHGYGAPGSDLVPVGETFASRAGIKVICLEAPLDVPGTGGGRSWWPMDMMSLVGLRDRGEYSKAVHTLAQNAPRFARDLLPELRSLTSSRANDHQDFGTSDSQIPVFFAGFSQGAMLAAELAWHNNNDNRDVSNNNRVKPVVDKLTTKTTALNLAGLIVFSSVPYPGRQFSEMRLPVFYSYGTDDPYLQGDVTQTAVKQFGGDNNPYLHTVMFSGGHTIPADSLKHSIYFVDKALR